MILLKLFFLYNWTAGNGEPCSSDSNCTEPEQFCKKIYNPGTCDEGLCTCMDGYTWETNKCSKWIELLIGRNLFRFNILAAVCWLMKLMKYMQRNDQLVLPWTMLKVIDIADWIPFQQRCANSVWRGREADVIFCELFLFIQAALAFFFFCIASSQQLQTASTSVIV